MTLPNKPTARERRDCVAIPFERRGRGGGESECWATQ